MQQHTQPNDAAKQTSLGNRIERYNEHHELVGVEYMNRPQHEVEAYVAPKKGSPVAATHVFDQAVLDERIRRAKGFVRAGEKCRTVLVSPLAEDFKQKFQALVAEGYSIDWDRQISYKAIPGASHVMSLLLPEAKLLELEAVEEEKARQQYAADLQVAQAEYMQAELARRVAEHQESVRIAREEAEAELAAGLMEQIAAEMEAANTAATQTQTTKKATAKKA